MLGLKRTLGIGLAVAALAATTAFVGPQLSQAAPADSAPYHGRGPGAGDLMADGPGGEYLAEALDITTDELTAAYEEAQDAAIQQALDEGLITEAQAEQLEDGTARGGKLLLRWSGADIDYKALLADALGITTEQLDAAQQEAADARLAQAVEDGRITQEQADLMQARQALRQYIEENDYYSKAVEAAVADGAITQAQADALLAARTERQGFGGFGDFGGMRGGHHGMRGGRMPGGPGDFMQGGQGPMMEQQRTPAQGSSS
jgi:hypothetical protein